MNFEDLAGIYDRRLKSRVVSNPAFVHGLTGAPLTRYATRLSRFKENASLDRIAEDLDGELPDRLVPVGGRCNLCTARVKRDNGSAC